MERVRIKKEKRKKAIFAQMLKLYTYDKEKIAKAQAERDEKRAQKEADRKAEEERRAKHEAEEAEVFAAKKAAKQKAMEAEVIRSEEDAQKAYEEFVKDTNGSIDAKSKDIVNKSETRAKAEGDRVEAKEDKETG